MTKDEAVTAAFETLSKIYAAPDPQAVVALAQWLYEGEVEEFEEDEDEDEGEPVHFVGPVRMVGFLNDDDYRLAVSPFDGGNGPGVAFQIVTSEAYEVIDTMILSIRDARGLGAGILNAADEAQGEIVSVFAVPDEPGPEQTDNEGTE